MPRIGYSGDEDFGYVFVGEPGEYDPIWDDHEPAVVDVDSSEVLGIAGIYSDVTAAAAKLGLSAPVIFFVDLREYREVARYVNGTNANPVILFDPDAHRDALPSEDMLSLFHELGHAYVESWGLDGQEPDEEEVVEEFAQLYVTDPDMAAAELAGWAASRAEEY